MAREVQCKRPQNVILLNNDVIVVGAGPTGSFSALQAAKLGVQVTVCEEHSEIGLPSHCTGHISLTGLKRLNLNLPESVFENTISSVIFHSPSGYEFSVDYDFPVTCVVNRMLFDQYLSGRASEAGVKFLKNTSVDSFLVEKGSIKGVSVTREKKVQKLRSKVVINAEGVTSNLLKRAGLSSPNRQMIVNGIQAEVDSINGISEGTVEVFLNQNFASGLYAWIVPRRDSTAKVGLATAQGNVRDCLSKFIRHDPIAKEKLKHSSIMNITYHPITLGGPISPTFSDGLLIVGDAASQVKSTTGGGIITGLLCAEIAGKTAAQAVHSEVFSSSALSRYESQWRKRIGFDMMVMKYLRIMLNSFSNKQLDKIIAFCSRSELDYVLKEIKDVDLQGTSLRYVAKNPRFLAIALYLLTIFLL